MSSYTKNLWIDGAHFQVRLTGVRKGEATVEVRQVPDDPWEGESGEWQTAGEIRATAAGGWYDPAGGVRSWCTLRADTINYVAREAARGIVLRALERQTGGTT